eukprot:6260700-Prymnesium_polylepis.1
MHNTRSQKSNCRRRAEIHGPLARAARTLSPRTMPAHTAPTTTPHAGRPSHSNVPPTDRHSCGAPGAPPPVT